MKVSLLHLVIDFKVMWLGIYCFLISVYLSLLKQTIRIYCHLASQYRIFFGFSLVSDIQTPQGHSIFLCLEPEVGACCDSQECAHKICVHVRNTWYGYHMLVVVIVLVILICFLGSCSRPVAAAFHVSSVCLLSPCPSPVHLFVRLAVAE